MMHLNTKTRIETKLLEKFNPTHKRGCFDFLTRPFKLLIHGPARWKSEINILTFHQMITSKLQNYNASCGAVPNAWKAFTVAVVIDDQISIRRKESNGASLFKPFPL